jgi:predicted alpha/beta hydrolase
VEDLVHVAAASDETAHVVLVLPAMGVPAGYYRPLLDGLAGSGLHAAALDLPGLPTDRRPERREEGLGYASLAGEVIPRARDHLARRFPRAAGTVLLGHSLGGQLALVHLALSTQHVAGVALVAAGTPHWRGFRGRRRPLVLAQTRVVAATTRVLGYWPGDRLGFGGRQPRALIRDWATLARTGELRPRGVDVDVEVRLAAVRTPVLAVDVAGDEFAPPTSVAELLAKVPAARVTRCHHAGDDGPPGHARWARSPGGVVTTVTEWVGTLVSEADRAPGPSPEGRTR